MKRIRIAGLCLMAIVAVSAKAVASASAALPEFVAVKFPISFTLENISPLEATLHNRILENNIVCKLASGRGEIAGSKSLTKVLILYAGCNEGEAPTHKCTTTGQSLGTIVTKNFDGLIGYVTGLLMSKIVGTELVPESGTILTEFTCQGAANAVVVEGCIIGEATPINMSRVFGNLLFEELVGGGQKYTAIDGGKHQPCKQTVTATILKLKSEGWLMDQETEAFSESVELKA